MSEILNMELTFWKTGEQYGFHAFYEEVKNENFEAVPFSAWEKDLPAINTSEEDVEIDTGGTYTF